MSAQPMHFAPPPQGQPPVPLATPGVVRAPVLLQVAGPWGLRALFEISLAFALLVAVVAGGPPRAWAILACLVLLPLLAFTRKMLILDPSTRVARGASVLRWFTSVQVPFDALRPWIHTTHEVTTYKNRDTGSTRTHRHNRRLLHLVAGNSPPFARSTSEFSGFDRFAIVVHAFVGAPVDPSMLRAAHAAERVRVLTRAIVSSVLAALLIFMTLVFAYGTGAVAAVLAVVATAFVVLSAGRWLAVRDAAMLRAPQVAPPPKAPVLAAHGAAFGLMLVAFPIVVYLHGAHRDERLAAYAAEGDEASAMSAKQLAAQPARGNVAPPVMRPAQVNAVLSSSAVLTRLTEKGFRPSSKSVEGYPQLEWRIEARTGGTNGGTMDVTLRTTKSLKVSGRLVGMTWVSVYSQGGDTDITTSEKARAAVLAYITSRSTSDATLKEALVAAGVANVTARAGQAWGWFGPKRQEFSVEAIPVEESSSTVVRSCTVSTRNGLLCAELNRAIYEKTDPNFATYALAVAAGVE